MDPQNSNAAWNPAFMPNSDANVAIQSRYHPEPSIQTSQAPVDSEKPHPKTPPSETSSAEDSENEMSKTGDSIDENNAHSEIENLRDALATSLASPGGVEMAETPWHSEESQPEVAEEEKADFPSEWPSFESKESKHLSTMSFARTVSQDVNWGEDDEVDPEYNLHRSDTDPFKFMAKSDRTNSFPQVPPAHAPVSNHHEGPLPHSQAEEIMNEIEHNQRVLFEDEAADPETNLFSQKEELPSSPGASLEQVRTQQHESNDHGQTYGGDAAPEEDEESEARYEEGLPLVQASGNSGTESKEPQATFNGFEDNDTGEEDDFFAQAIKTDESHDEAPTQQLGRKSTMQVINSLNFQPTHPLHDDIIDEDTESSQSSLDQATRGSIGASTSTALPQVLGVPEAPIHDQPRNSATLELESAEEDLAEKWKAALAGDEFLDDDDDELLPDDDDLPAESSALDPSALFGSDDEGFLEDNEDQNALTNVFSPPVSTPLTTPNGHVTGFDSLSNRAVNAARPGSSGSIGRYLPAGATTAVQPASKNVYAPTAPLLTDLSRASSAPAPAPSPYMSAVSNFQPPQAERPELPKAQSFADKSKGGYHSPYDLPMDVVKPRKRLSMQQMNRASAAPANIAPPRSNSMTSQPPRSSSSTQSPLASSHSFPQSQGTSGQPTPPIKTVRKSQSGFFEELPMSAKPKLAPRHSASLGSPAQSRHGQPPHSIPPPPMQHQPAPTAQSPFQQGLVAPERVSPYAQLPSGNVSVPPVASRYSPAPPQPSQMAPPVAQSRYSPAPTVPRQHTPSYSTSSQLSQPAAPLPHQPRTSSPLAHFERSNDARSHSFSSELSFDRRSSSSGHESSLRYQHLPPTREVDENEQLSPPGKSYGELQNRLAQPLSPPSRGPRQGSHTPPPPQGIASRVVNSPSKRTTPNYAPQQASSSAPPPVFLPPKRSQTQSPETGFAGPRLGMSAPEPYQRPASVEVPTSPQVNIGYPTTSRPRGFSQGLNYIAPTDGREHDPLQRWKGAPIFAWGLGGTIVTSFPKDVPRYGMNQTAPMIIRSPGGVKVRSIKDLDPLQPRLTSFPGPLKGKSKKKEVLAWLSSGIDILEQNVAYLKTTHNLTHEDKRTKERILLWKILRVLVEYDGTLEGSPAVEKAVRAVLSPGIDDEVTSAPLYATGAELSSISRSSAAPKADPVDPTAVDQLRKHLLRGEREKAVWEAVDKRLWAHAMLISNTVSRDLYKQVAQEFVQKEVKNIGDNTESLAALYEIFAGNFEESIDELVPPSARAGFQMISTSNAAPSKDALDGLDRWRETLGLVLSNRSIDDAQALNALGKLLSGYGRAEAAHICFLFARNISIFGGVDDPQASIVLVGSDHLRQPYDFDREMEPILLSEVYEYGMSLAAPASALVVSSPHLSIYKLQHAKILAEYGYRDKALQYCEAIATSINSQTRRSPYHHALLGSELDDLSKRLKQSPKDDSGSWISKPSIDKAKGSVWATFNKFVSGEGEDEVGAGTAASGGGEVGPFARIAGGTPMISRSPSTVDFLGSYNGNGSAAMPIAKTNPRYAPSDSYSTPNHDPHSYGSQPRSSLEERSSNEFRRYDPQRQSSDYRPGSQPVGAPGPYTPQPSSSYTPSAFTPQANSSPSYEPSPSYAPQTPATEQAPPNVFSSPQPMTSFDGPPRRDSSAPSERSYSQPQNSTFEAPSNIYSPPSGGYEPFASNSYEQPQSSSYDPPTSNGYEPPSPGGYEPPSSGDERHSYQPASMNDEPESPIETRPKKSFMDDDDDDIPALRDPSGTREKTKAEKDREADEAFRKAAEADGKPKSVPFSSSPTKSHPAQKAKESAPAKKGWGLTGWFGSGAKKEGDTSQPNKPIRAKLGEESSFVYDPDLKRWVNKKGGAEQTEARTATPPPPRMGPPRTASAGPRSQPRPISMSAAPPQQRAVSDQGNFPPLHAQSQSLSNPGSLAPPVLNRTASSGSLRGSSGPSTAPASRPGTAMSNASSIDDLLGPPLPRKAGAKGGKKKGRGYVDVMGEKAS